ncbi:EAL domain-containing protein [Kordiimonas aestuarii]|uniref:EAL domain-containing protein n=1 Tax=Kordiimonas aestuarii TaxID=1005925 RepID=UPI0021CE487B|nr:EAL domain-containing protein [Kordiimonas aestuarii]
MSIMTQILLLVSYAVLGVAITVIPPRAFEVPSDLSSILGLLVFFGAWQIQMWLIARRAEKDADSRLEKLEDMVLILRKDLERTRRHGEKGDEKSDQLVSELKVLHTLLTQVMEREVEFSAKPKKAKKSGTDEEALQLSADTEVQTKAGKAEAPVAPEPEDKAEPMSEAEIAELELTPEEAAMAVVDSGSDEVDRDDEDESESNTDALSDAIPKPVGKAAPKGLGRKKAPIRLIKREDQLLSVVRNSLSENRVDLYLQPIVALPARRTVHYECFSRVRDDEGRIVLPRQYMKIAESKGLIGTIDNLLLFRLIQLVRRMGKRRPDVRFFCNMSKYSMADEEFFPQFIDFMTANEEFRDRLVFEIAQEDYMTLEGDVKDRLLTLGRKGFGFSMDLVKDFNQDFALLGDRKFQFIKSDLQDLLAANPEDGDAEAVKSFLRRKGMQLIVSRIENEDMVLQALEARAEFAQGYLFGEPTAANDMNREL